MGIAKRESLIAISEEMTGCILKPSKRLKLLVVFLFLLLLSAVACAGDVIVFSTPPTQTAKITMERYGPLAKYLTKKLGRKVVLRPAANFIQYSQALLDNEYDLIFDGPHFIGWRIVKQNHLAIAKLPGKLYFAIISKKGSGLVDYRRLAGKRVCGVGSPNLMTLGMLDLYPNPASVPVIVPTNGFKGALKCLKSGQGVAAVMPAKFWHKRPGKVKKGLGLIFESRVYWPHRGFSVGKRIDAATQQKIKDALLSPEGFAAAKNIFKRYKTNRFVTATDKEYSRLGKLLRPIWGFHR